MAIAVDTSQHSTSHAASSSTWTFSSIVVNAANEYIVVGVWNQTAAATVSTPKYNSTAMTQLATVGVPGAGGNLYLFGLLNPSTGTNSFTCTTLNPSDTCAGIALVYSGTHQTTPTDGTNTNTSTSGTSMSVAITPSVDNGVMFSVVADNDGGGTITASTNIHNLYDGYNTTVYRSGDNVSGTAPTGGVSFTEAFTVHTGDHCGAVAVMLQPPATATANGNFLAFM